MQRVKSRKGLLIISGILLVVGGLLGGLWLANRFKKSEVTTPALISSQITQKLSFPVYIPGNDSVWLIDTSKTTYDQTSGVLSLNINHNDAQIILTQQATPQVFSDVPQQYSKMLATMNEFSELQTSFGTVTLTRPKELKGGQTAVTNKGSTLLFAKPNHDLSENEWKAFFNDLRTYK